MSEISAKSFLGLLQKSKLCENAELKASLSELSKKANGKPIKLDQLTSHLLDDGLISEWHIKKLVAGKYKGFFLGKYKLLRHLGTGGMSTVYLAQHTIFDQQRAIKVLPRERVADKTYLERFFREGRAAAALNDKNIVRVYDIGNEADTHYLVMEYVKGKDIYEMVNENGPLPFDRSIDYMIQSLTGLKHAHETDLVHRDVKPANLLVTEEGVVKILDLGLALFQEDDSSLTVMHNERVLGTADYLSPEQAVDSHNLDHRSDIYSAGCTLYFMLTGKPPFFEGTLAQRIAKHLSVEPQDIREFRPDCPEELVQLVSRMMKKKPEERFQSCDDAIFAFRAVSENLLLGSATSPSSIVPPAATKPPIPIVETKKELKKQPSVQKKPVQKEQRKERPVERKQPAAKKQAPVSKEPVSDQVKETHATLPVVDPVQKSKPEPKQPKKESKPVVETKQTLPKHAVAKKPSVKEQDAEPAKKPLTKKTTVPKRVAKQPEGKQPVIDPQPASSTSGKKQPAIRKNVIDVGRKVVDPNSVSVVVNGPEASKAQASIVGVSELNQFVTKTQSTARKSVRPKRTPVKNQMMLAGMVVGMLLLLGLIVVMAMWFIA